MLLVGVLLILLVVLLLLLLVLLTPPLRSTPMQTGRPLRVALRLRMALLSPVLMDIDDSDVLASSRSSAHL